MDDSGASYCRGKGVANDLLKSLRLGQPRRRDGKAGAPGGRHQDSTHLKDTRRISELGWEEGPHTFGKVAVGNGLELIQRGNVEPGNVFMGRRRRGGVFLAAGFPQ